MTRTFLSAALAATAFSVPASADAPRVAVDIAPIHGLVSQVMDGVGVPDLVIPQGASPHDHALRPSEARALDRADLVVWMGPELAPWMEKAVDSLAKDAKILRLLGADGLVLLEFREGISFATATQDARPHEHHDGDREHEHGHDHEDNHDHAHDENHADKHDHGHGEDHADKHAHADHAEHGHDGHDHSGTDPHAWLDPENARFWLDVIAGALSDLDPANEAAYRANAAAGQEEIAGLVDRISATLEPARGAPFVVYHDAYQYFENRFDLPVLGAISQSDATDPSPARVDALRDAVGAEGVRCVFSEPQFDPGLVSAVTEGKNVGVAVLDPLGASLALGPGFYTTLLENIAGDIAGCLTR